MPWQHQMKILVANVTDPCNVSVSRKLSEEISCWIDKL
jgi:hypothetical protein